MCYFGSFAPASTIEVAAAGTTEDVYTRISDIGRPFFFI
jgi:hypothetical protein